jgi:ferredoxin
MTTLKVRIDKVRCIGAGQCVLASPQVFDQREEDGIVMLLMEEVSEDLSASVRKAARSCPAAAIKTEKL